MVPHSGNLQSNNNPLKKSYRRLFSNNAENIQWLCNFKLDTIFEKLIVHYSSNLVFQGLREGEAECGGQLLSLAHQPMIKMELFHWSYVKSRRKLFLSGPSTKATTSIFLLTVTICSDLPSNISTIHHTIVYPLRTTLVRYRKPP